MTPQRRSPRRLAAGWTLAGALAIAGWTPAVHASQASNTAADPAADRPALAAEVLRGIAAGLDVRAPIAAWQALGSGPARRPLPPRDHTAAAADRALAELQKAVAPATPDPERVLAAFAAYAAQDLLVRDELDRAQVALDKIGAGGEMRERLTAARTRYLAVSDRLHAALDAPAHTADTAHAARGKSDEAEKRNAIATAAAAARAALVELPSLAAAPPPILRAAVLPYRREGLPGRTPALTPAVAPSYLSPTEVPEQAADLAPTPEAPLAPEILAKAAELGHDYARIYDFVRDEVDTEWYAGSQKGALGTLLQMSGNDVDQASLLIALFRASQLPARYVRGVVELPLDRFAADLGLTDPNAIGDYLTRAGVANAPVVRGGRVAAFRVAATWVAAHVPYTNYRGAVVDFSGKTWLPLAPAAKVYVRTPPTGVLRRMGLDAAAFITTYLSDLQVALPLDALRAQVEAWLRQNAPAETYAGQLGTRAIDRRALGLLPNTLPVTVVAVTGEAPALSDADRCQVHFVVRGGDAATAPALLDLTLPLAAVAGERVTLSYIPATVDDHSLVDLYGGLENVPAYLVHLRPELKLGGRQVAVAQQALEMGVPHRLEIGLLGPANAANIANPETVVQTLLAGGYHAIAFGAQHFVARVPPADDPGDTEYQAASLLSGIAYAYGARWDAAEGELGGLLDVAVARPLPAVVVAANAVAVETALGLRQRLLWQGVTLDAALRIAEPVGRSADAAANTASRRDWMRLSGLHGSALEHALFEEQFQVDSLSADKGLGLVRHGGGAVVTVTSANLATVLPTLGHPPEVKADVEAWARQGMVVEIPVQPLLRNAWRGAVWRVDDPATGAAGYFLAGGLAGGATTQPPDNWLLDFIRDALAAPFEPGPDLDPLAGAQVTKLAETDGQEGEAGKRFRNDLSVAVRDAVGRPVKGASVTFSVFAGNGTLIDDEKGVRAARVVVATDELGLASVGLESGKHTNDNPVYVERNPGDENVTRALDNVVEVEVATHRGPLAPDQAFDALGYPGPAATLRRTDKTQTEFQFQDAGAWVDTIVVAVEDAYGNAVSNAAVTFAVGSMVSYDGCSNPPPSPQNAVVFDTTDARCPKSPVLGECGAPTLIRWTSPFGTSAGVILGNSVIAGYRVNVSTAALPPLSYFYSVAFSQFNATGECSPFQATVRLQTSTLVDAQGRNLQAVRQGQLWGQPLETTLTVFIVDSTPVQKPDGHWGAQSYPQGSWQRASGDVSFAIDGGGSISPAVSVGSGRYQGSVTAGPTPGFEAIRATAANIVIHNQKIDPDTGALTPNTDVLPGPVTQPAGGIWSVLPRIVDVAPDPIVLTDAGITSEPVTARYTIDPAAYAAGNVGAQVLEDGAAVAFVNGSALSGSGSFTLPRGNHYDRSKTYTLAMALNGGSTVEVDADPFELPLHQRILRDVAGGSVSQDVDLVNQRTCERDSVFSYSLNQEATVTLVIRRLEGQNPDGSFTTGIEHTLIPGEDQAQGDHTLPLNTGNVPPGDWQYELTAVATADGHTEKAGGTLTSQYNQHGSLAVGHTLVKGVDLWDGHLTVSRQDFQVPGRGAALDFARSYSSNASKEEGFLGLGWSHNYESKVVVTPCGEAVVQGGDGSGMRFVDDGQGGLKPLKGYHGSLVFNRTDGTFDFFAKNGDRWHYRNLGSNKPGDTAWSLDSITDPNGNATALTYQQGTDGKQQLKTVRDAAGRELTFTYTFSQFYLWKGFVVTGLTGPGGLAMSFEYDKWGNLARAAREGDSRIEIYGYEIVPNNGFELRQSLVSATNGLDGGVTRYKYDVGKVGLLTAANLSVNTLFVKELTEPEGGVTGFAYDIDALSRRSAFEVITHLTDARGKVSVYHLNQYGSPLEIHDPLDHVTRMSWAPDDIVMTQRTDPNGVVTDFTYDTFGNLRTETVHVTDFDGHAHTYTRETTYWAPETFAPPYVKDRVKTSTDRNGVVRSREYDAHGNLTQESIPITQVDGTAQSYVVAHSYATNGDRLSTVDARGNATFFDYDAYGNVAKVTDPRHGVTLATWNERSLETSSTDALGHLTKMDHDTLGRPTRTTFPAIGGDQGPAFETTDYDDVKDTRTATDAEGRATVTHLDHQGRTVEIDNAAGGTRLFTYDGEGNKKSESAWFDATTPRIDVLYDYDDAGRLARRTEPLGRITDYQYDAAGNAVRETLSSTADASFPPRVTATAFDALNRPIHVSRTADVGVVESFTRYDGEGNKLLVRDPRGFDTTARYDELNRLLERSEPESKVTRFAYDGNGNLVQQTLVNRVGTDNRDQVRQMAYDELNRLMRATDAEGKDTTYEHDAVGDLLRQVDPLQNAVGHTYDERNRRITTTVHLNRVTTPNRDVTTGFVYDRVGNLRETHHPNGNVVTETYDNLNRVTATTDSLGAVAAATYDARGNHLTETDANGHVTTNHFDDLDRLTRQELPEHRTVSMAYDAAGNKTSETDPRGNVRQLQYDRLNRPVKTIDPAPFAFTVEMTYDAAGNKLTEKDRRGNLTTYGYDGLNRVNHTLSAAPFRYETSATYDPAGNKLSETDRRGIATAHDYDRENRLLRTVRDGLQIAESVYDPAGNRITLYDAKRNRVDYEYDERRIETAQLAPLGATTRHTLDDMGDRVLSVDPEGRQTARVFDLRRRLHQETNGAGETTETAYDRKGNRTGVKRPKGTSWTYGYDDADRLTKVIDPLQHETDYQYDPNGNRTVQHDANGHETIFTYDELNRLATMAYPQAAGIAAHEEYGYDENGNRTRLLDALGQEIRSTFDELNRESLRNYPIPASGTGLQSIAYVYDANNNPTGVTETYAAAPQNTVYTTARTYDHFDRLAAVTDRYGKALTYSYDPNGNRSQLVDPDGKTTVYGYDALNRLTSVTIPGAAPTTYSYFKNGLLQQVTYPNGTTATYAHDLANRVQSIANQQGTVVVSSYDYHYDPNGNRSQQIEVNGGAAETTTYGFDDADRLTAVAYPDKSVAYTYDAVGNRLTERATGSQGAGLAAKTYTYDERNRLLSVSDSVGAAGLVTYTYDANGNRTSRTQNGVVTQLVYDVRDQLTEVRSNSALVESYAYDYRGLRVRKAGSGALLRYVYDDKSVLLQTDDAGNTLAKYDYGPDRLLALTHATEGRQFYLFDALGSVADLMTPGGTLQARYQYDAWGNYRHQAGSSANVFGFTGHELDAATGLYYFKARFYDPETGSFLTEDSSPGQPDTPPTLDLYLYAYANPTVYVDPTGHATEPTRVDKHRPRVLNPGEKAPPGWTVTAPDEDGTRIATPPAAPPPAPAEEEPAWYVRAWNGFLEFIGEKKVEQRVKEGVQAVQTGGKHFDEGTTKPRLDEENPAEGYNQNIKIGLKATRQVLTEDSKKVGVKAVQTGMAAGEMALNLDGARELAGALYKVTKNGVSIVVDRQAAKRLEGQGWHISEEVQSASRAKTGPGAFVPKSESMDERALEYEKAVAGGQEGKTYRVPYKNPNPRGKPHVDFDGVAPTGAPIDAKVAIVTRQKTVNQAMRQAEALRQNGAKGIWKVPDLREARRAKEVLRRAGAQDTIIVVVEKP